MALSGNRDESTFVNQQLVQQDVESLYKAGAGKIGTVSRPLPGETIIDGVGRDCHLRHLAVPLGRPSPSYRPGIPSTSSSHSFEDVSYFARFVRISLMNRILSEFSGHMQDGLYYIARAAEMDGRGVVRDVELLQASMAGMGTKDERLCYRLVRLSWNRQRFAAIKGQYQSTYGKSLKSAVQGETTGKYENALVGIIDQN